MPLFLMGCFPVDFQEVKRPLRTKSVKRPIKVGKRPINEGKRPIKAKVLVGVSVGCLMGCFRAPPPWRKTAPLKRPSKRSMIYRANGHGGFGSQTAADPLWRPHRTPEKQTVGTVTASHKMLTLQALSALLMPALQGGAAWAKERLLGALRQSVSQNGRVHLHIRDIGWQCLNQRTPAHVAGNGFTSYDASSNNHMSNSPGIRSTSGMSN